MGIIRLIANRHHMAYSKKEIALVEERTDDYINELGL